VYSNAELARIFNVPSGVVTDVEAKIGTRSRYSATDLRSRRQVVASSTLGASAAQAAAARAGVDASEIGAVIGCTTILDHMCPSLAVCVLKEIGAVQPALTFDLYGGCGSTASAVFLAAELLQSRLVDSVLVIAAEVLTRQLWMLRQPFELFLFGDGAAALLLSTRYQGPLRLRRYTAGTVPDLDGVREEIMTVPVVGGGALPALLSWDDHFDATMPDVGCPPAYRAQHQARLAAKWGAAYMARAIRTVVGTIDSDLFVVPHQPSRVVVDSVRTALGLDPAQVAIINPTHGNLSSASVPMALCEQFDDCMRHTRTVIAPVGTGLMTGAALFERVVSAA